jgi:hypothetical protein
VPFNPLTPGGVDKTVINLMSRLGCSQAYLLFMHFFFSRGYYFFPPKVGLNMWFFRNTSSLRERVTSTSINLTWKKLNCCTRT